MRAYDASRRREKHQQSVMMCQGCRTDSLHSCTSSSPNSITGTSFALTLDWRLLTAPYQSARYDRLPSSQTPSFQAKRRIGSTFVTGTKAKSRAQCPALCYFSLVRSTTSHTPALHDNSFPLTILESSCSYSASICQ